MASTTSNCTPIFQHIYYDDWKIGSTYERKHGKNVIYLGKLLKKQIRGRTYDPDIFLIFERADGTSFEHMVEFDHSYRCIH